MSACLTTLQATKTRKSIVHNLFSEMSQTLNILLKYVDGEPAYRQNQYRRLCALQ